MVVLKDKTLPKISITLGLTVAEGWWLSNGRGKTVGKRGAMPTGLREASRKPVGILKGKTLPKFSTTSGQDLTEG